MVPLVTLLRARKRAEGSAPTMLMYALRGLRHLMYGPEPEDMSADLSAPGSAARGRFSPLQVPPDRDRGL
uniref:Flavodoxin reductases (Ferredoxin-NADPH reductases) family 1 n=1 Tax=Nonomuraea gerenzanensis TaxID=93944 RepID=A0A1M4EB78_9ACTN|nr:Flavodoxin reductases (ferredoxin-NADPH reductases) family 1 [Nonomuraea gerenzanensis]